MKTKLLRKWKLLYKLCNLKFKFLTSASAYRSLFGDLFFCWFIKHHHLYETIKLECDILGEKPCWLWRENHSLHKKYAPSHRFKRRFSYYLYSSMSLDFASLYPFQMISSVPYTKVDRDFKLSEDISKICQDAS